MATFLDIGLVESFGVIFVVLLVFLIVYGLLEYLKVFGEGKRGLHGITAFVIALLFLISRTASSMVEMMVPWFIVLAIFIFFTLFMVRMFGRTEADMRQLIADPNVYPWLIALVGLILALSVGTAFGQKLLESGEGTQPTNTSIEGPILPGPSPGTTSTATPSFATNVINTLRHPKVLGLLFIFLIGMFAMIFLTKPAK
ncbi:hypothetical protein AYK26_01680 [Euryarchaeota archaeon SM23-78]|nr:MAG: hypothetical protein AYK26_01680 [Euryarchaeota archaeon SM23-78]MBW3000489.1 hypothetical protein [Candidatus Woesearchaeota archaeon]